MNEGLAVFLSSVVTGAASVLSVLIATRWQTGRIDRENKAALAAQTSEIKQHLEGGATR